LASATETYTIATAYVAPASTEPGPDELFRLDVLVEIRQSLQAAGDERFPLVFYRTEPELVAEAQF